MMKKYIILFLVLAFFTSLIGATPAFASSPLVEYLCELGRTFYRMGKYDDALEEFDKALMLDPHNSTAQEYVSSIFKEDLTQGSRNQSQGNAQEARLTEDNIPLPQDKKDEAGEPEKKELGFTVAGVKITGETQVSLGVTSAEAIWKRANGDLNEENWRILSDTAFNRRSNTYDPRIYDRLKVNLDKGGEEGFGFHTNITVDPWSFLGKTDNVNLIGAGGLDVAQVQMKYWSSTGYTVNEAIRTLEKGDSFALPEVKVVDGKTKAFSITSLNNNVFNIPEMKINREFQPLRELWFDYKNDSLKLKVFPMAYENQAYTSDDPLHLSNNHIWWQESPWIRKWVPGTLNTGLTPQDFVQGKMDNSLAYLAKDSDGKRLTALRGFTFDFALPDDFLSFSTTIAAPKDPWQEYSSVDNAMNATRLKFKPWENFATGIVYTFRYGVDEVNRRDMKNLAVGWDFAYEPIVGLKASAELATSSTKRDLTFPDYATKSKGNTFYISLVGRYPRDKIMPKANGYDELKPKKDEPLFAKFRFYASYMDSGFDPMLASYRETRDDAFWGRHIQFRKPFEYFYSGLYSPSLSWDDIDPYRIGNGIDAGRTVVGFRLEGSWEKQLKNLFDLRNVHTTSGKIVENVVRDELTLELTEGLTAKILGIYQKMPKTVAGKDPFIFDSSTGKPVNNTAIIDAQDPSLKTGSLGLEYALTDRVSINGIWERTNDYTLAYDNFPRGNLSSTSMTTFSGGGRIYRMNDPFLYSQGLFPLPPYRAYNIWKTGLRFAPFDDLDIGLDYTRNEFKSAGQIDDNINHVGMEAAYSLTPKLGFYLRYTYARWNDLTSMLNGYDKIYLGHNNFFLECRYAPALESELVMQYGEAGRSNVYTKYTDPFSSGLPTLDTQHIVRMYYRRKF